MIAVAKNPENPGISIISASVIGHKICQKEVVFWKGAIELRGNPGNSGISIISASGIGHQKKVIVKFQQTRKLSKHRKNPLLNFQNSHFSICQKLKKEGVIVKREKITVLEN